MKRNCSVSLILVLFILLVGCEDFQTSVENLNEPSSALVHSNPDHFPDIIDDSYLKFWQSIQLATPSYPITVMAQGGTSSWGGWGTRDVGTIPRQHFDNSESYINKGLFLGPWVKLYGAINPVNDILRLINQGEVIVLGDNGQDITSQIIANAKALQGLALGYLSLLYDQAFIGDEYTVITNEVLLSDYTTVNKAAIAKLEEAILLFENSEFKMTGWNGLIYEGNDAASLLKGFVAKFEVVKARNSAELSQIDWNKVLINTSGGLVDLAPVGDGQFWYSRMLIQGQFPQRYRVSQKVIRMMNTNKPMDEVPYPWPDDVVTLPEIENPNDQRMISDFTYNATVPFVRARGYYFFSSYHYSRYNAFIENNLLGPMNFLTVPELELLRAEALVRTNGDRTVAASIINKTRVARGGLSPMTGRESDEDLLESIAYERIVEFTWEGSCNVWFYRRMITPTDNMDSDNLYYLEPRTARHFPVPAEELSFLGMDVYTFGGDKANQ